MVRERWGAGKWKHPVCVLGAVLVLLLTFARTTVVSPSFRLPNITSFMLGVPEWRMDWARYYVRWAVPSRPTGLTLEHGNRPSQAVPTLTGADADVG